ncbi:ferric-chelate reductase [Setomelanomma holmii]|uniref:ferric-chelate reductase (NADPH) n=1 Tax=Setomelanomma holmii TaxID=210430 RepID=A0A9P4LH95_9PLEO|nr:ferric-chelate reductase [Setomelanomma holmii]
MGSMGSMDMPALDKFPKFYWAVVGSAVSVAALVNLYNHVLCRLRLSAANLGSPTPAKPASWFALGTATTYALAREALNFSLHIPLKNQTLRFPSVGRVSLVLANAITLIVLCLYGLDLTGRFTKEDVAFRCGVVTVGQIPLIFLLAGKNNIIGYLSGVSYERLNWLHRWSARTMLLTATIHMGYFFTSWARYNYIGWKLKNDNISWKGMTAWSVLVWIVFSSMTPIRGWCYELFLIQHLISFAIFIGFVYIHVPADFKVYVWIPVALFFFDRTIRALRALYANLSIFHPKLRKQGQAGGILSCRAEITPLPHDTTRVVIHNPPISWTPGQHVFLSCQSIALLQNHPFTIASIPTDGRMEFLIKSESGGTRHFFRHATKANRQPEKATRGRTVMIEGPYGCIRPLRQFDSVVLLAGSTGVTFTKPLLSDILQGWKVRSRLKEGSSKLSLFGRQDGAATRHVRFAWVVKSKGQLSWFSEQLSSVAAEFGSLQETLRDIKLELTIYVTCDESFTEQHNSLLSAFTAPNHTEASQSGVQHGAVQYRSQSQSAGQKEMTEKDEIRESVSSTSSESDGLIGKKCTCRTAVDETSTHDARPCCCSTSMKVVDVDTSSRPTSHASLVPSLNSKPTLFIHPSIKMYSGRPKTRDIIRRTLEQALGESAVVVCGPQGLVSDVKQDVCSLSDERAVHKGTGAQGIYLHTESFSY